MGTGLYFLNRNICIITMTGFNESNNFLTDLPNINIIRYCDIYFPGTAYNLHFIMERANDRN